MDKLSWTELLGFGLAGLNWLYMVGLLKFNFWVLHGVEDIAVVEDVSGFKNIGFVI